MNYRNSDMIQPGVPYTIKSDNYIRIKQFSIFPENDQFIGDRITIMANVKTLTNDKREIEMNAALTSFIVGEDFDQQCDLVISPMDNCTLTVIGSQIPVQIIYYM